jgi:excisionase family DNA binding protein
MKKVREELLTLKEFAEVFDCTVSCARRWIRQGRVASLKIGPRLVRIPGSEVERLLMEGLRPISTDQGGKQG